MDERKNGVKEPDAVAPTPARQASADQRADELARDIQHLRDHIETVAGELDRRRHDLFDLKRQLRRHPVPLALIGAAIVSVAGGAIALAVLRRRQRATWADRLARFRTAMRRATAHPDRVARSEPSVARKIAAAAAAGAASVIARRLARRLVA